jgi:CRP/FNR family transcriptional regulator, cyclic AMP receptor protein
MSDDFDTPDQASRRAAIELRQIVLLGDLSHSELALLGRVSRRRSFRRGELILNPHSASGQVIMIIAGRVRLYRVSRSGRSLTLASLNAGSTCNLAFLNSSVENTSHLVATIDNTIVYSMSAPDLLRAASKSSGLATRLISLLSDEVSVAHDRMEDLALADVKHRLVNTILRAQAIGRTFFTHDELAGEVGVHREDITRVLHDLVKAQVLRLNPADHTVEILKDDWG